MSKAASVSLILGILFGCATTITSAHAEIDWTKEFTICIGVGNSCHGFDMSELYSFTEATDGPHAIDAAAKNACLYLHSFDTYVSDYSGPGPGGGVYEGKGRCACKPGRKVSSTGCH